MKQGKAEPHWGAVKKQGESPACHLNKGRAHYQFRFRMTYEEEQK